MLVRRAALVLEGALANLPGPVWATRCTPAVPAAPAAATVVRGMLPGAVVVAALSGAAGIIVDVPWQSRDVRAVLAAAAAAICAAAAAASAAAPRPCIVCRGPGAAAVITY